MIHLNRRSFLKGLVATTAAAVVPGFPSLLRGQAPSAGTRKRPNVVLIMADDMGFSDLGCYGSEIATPNLDRLAGGGMRFTQFYNTARCCPTRASLLTGLYSHQAGVGHMVANLGLPGYQGFLNDRCATVAELLKDAKYHPLMVGKWHVGGDRRHWPVDRGFEHYYGLVDGGSNYFAVDPGRTFAKDGERIRPAGENFYMTDAFTDAAVGFIGDYAAKPDPFFLYVAFTAPHWPLHARPEEIAKYKDAYKDGWDKLREQRRRKMIELGLIDKSLPLTPRDPTAPAWDDVKDKEAEAHKMTVYAAQIDRMDQCIGRILTKLKETGVDQDTLVMFCADNGGCAEEVHRGQRGAVVGTKESFDSYGLPWANASNTPFRRYKHWVHEGGISSPLIAYWPGVIPANTMSREVGHMIDLVPTCMDVAGYQQPKALGGREILPIEGRSLLPAFKGGKIDRPSPLYWEHEGNRAIRQGKWKLVAPFGGEWELYDLESDRTELKNLAKDQPEKLKELSESYDAWAQRCNVVPWRQVQGRKPASLPATKPATLPA